MAKRRPSGDGMVRHRSDGRWEGRIVIGHKADGTSVFRYVYAPTQKELTAKLHGEIEDCRGVDIKEKCRLTVEEWLTRWLDEYAAPRVREGTLRGYRLSIEKYIVPRMGERRLTALKERDLRRLYKFLLRNGRLREAGGLSPTTVRKTHALLHRALDDAVRARLIPRNPADGITLPKGERPPLRVLTDAELTTFMDALEDDPWHDFFYLELTTGLRRGEICGLMWSDFDTGTGTLKISRTLHARRGGGVTVGEPKTATGVRKLLLPPSTAQLLRERKRSAVSQWIFPNPLHPECPINPGSAYTNLKRLLKKVGLPDIRFHDLRHTFATHAIAGGVDAKTLSGILGHTDAAFTLNTYAHVTGDMHRRAAEIVGGFMEDIFGKELKPWQDVNQAPAP